MSAAKWRPFCLAIICEVRESLSAILNNIIWFTKTLFEIIYGQRCCIQNILISFFVVDTVFSYMALCDLVVKMSAALW